jgi:hypothetical protein
VFRVSGSGTCIGATRASAREGASLEETRPGVKLAGEDARSELSRSKTESHSVSSGGRVRPQAAISPWTAWDPFPARTQPSAHPRQGRTVLRKRARDAVGGVVGHSALARHSVLGALLGLLDCHRQPAHVIRISVLCHHVSLTRWDARHQRRARSVCAPCVVMLQTDRLQRSGARTC